MISLLQDLHSLDMRLLLLINHSKSPFLDHLMKTVSDFGLFFPIIALFILYRLIRGKPTERVMWIVGIAAIISSDILCARILKPLVGRARPYTSVDGLYVLKGSRWLLTDPGIRARFGPTLSWPSCHATNMWTATSYLVSFMPRIGLVVAFFALLVSYSRVYLGLHYPGDCLGGFIVGSLWGLLFALLTKAINRFFFKDDNFTLF